MEKWINTFLHGDKKTIVYIVSVLIGAIATIGFAIASISFAINGVLKLSFLFGGLFVLFGVITAILLQKYVLQDKLNPFSFNSEEVSKENLEENSHELEKLSDKEDIEKDDKELAIEAPKANQEKSIYDDYSERKLEQIFRKYKVKQEHRKIMIDNCASFRIRQCPAIIWKNKKSLCVLLIEEKPRFISVPLKEITDIYYERGIVANSKEDYNAFKKSSYITTLFSPYLPNYYQKLREQEKKTYKNLYVIGQDLKVTNTSARNLFDILELEFGIEDKIMESSRFSPYFKLAYKSHILLQDRVINVEEYKQRIQMILTVIAEDEEEKRELDELLDQLTEAKLLTKEYADYYREKFLG